MVMFRATNHFRVVSHGRNSFLLKSLFTMADIAGRRMPFRDDSDIFDVEDLASVNPITQFADWFKEACETPGIEEPNVMSLATASRDGRPSVRMVLMKGFDETGLKFFTNYNSRKARELDENPFCGVTFYWTPLKRCVRIEGSVEKLPPPESTEYFHTRPRESQIGAIVSDQSKVVSGRNVLDSKYKNLLEEFKDESKLIPKPEHWGGYLIKPNVIEFWQGQTNRIHDRIRFRLPTESSDEDPSHAHQGEDGWVFERLCP